MRASVATVYVTFIEWGQRGGWALGSPSAELTTHFGDTESATGPRHHQTSPTPLSLLFANKDGSERVLQHLLSLRGLV